MKPLDAHPELAQAARVLKIIGFALAAGLGIFLGIVAWLHYVDGQSEPPEDAGLLTTVAVAAGGLVIVTMQIVRSALVRAALGAYSKDDPAPFAQKFTAAVLAGLAGIEGAGFLLATAFLIEKDSFCLIAGCVCVLLLVATTPSRDSLNHLLEQIP